MGGGGGGRGEGTGAGEGIAATDGRGIFFLKLNVSLGSAEKFVRELRMFSRLELWVREDLLTSLITTFGGGGGGATVASTTGCFVCFEGLGAEGCED